MRLEIIANHTVEEDIIEAVRNAGGKGYYTKIPVVHGAGGSNPRQGSPVWPEENFLLIVYCEEEAAARIADAVAQVKSWFKNEGIKVYAIRDAVEVRSR